MIIFVAHVIGLEEKHLQELEVLHLHHQKIVLNVTQKWLKDILQKTHNIFGVVQTFQDVQELEDFN